MSKFKVITVAEKNTAWQGQKDGAPQQDAEMACGRMNTAAQQMGLKVRYEVAEVVEP